MFIQHREVLPLDHCQKGSMESPSSSFIIFLFGPKQSMKNIANTIKFFGSESVLCTNRVLIAFKYLTLLALQENRCMVTQGENSGLGGHRAKKK